MPDTYTDAGGPYIFGGNTGYSAADLKRLREYYASLREKAYPKNVGEGVYSVGESIADAIRERRLEQLQRKVDTNEAQQAGTLRRPDAAVGAEPPSAAPAPMPTASAPAPAPDQATPQGPVTASPLAYRTAGTDLLATPENQQRLAQNWLAAGRTPAGELPPSGIGSSYFAGPPGELTTQQPATPPAFVQLQRNGPLIAAPPGMSGRDALTAAVIDQERRGRALAYAPPDQEGGGAGNESGGDAPNPTLPGAQPPATSVGSPPTTTAGATDLFRGRPIDRITGSYDEPPNATDMAAMPPGARLAQGAVPPTVGSTPSQEPIPPMIMPENKHPGAPPARPAQVPFTENQWRAFQIMSNPGNSEGLRANAKSVFDIEEMYRKKKQEQVDHDYGLKLSDWYSNVKEFEKRNYEMQEKIANQLKLRQDIESGRVTLKKTEKDLAAPTEHIIGGAIYQQKFDQQGRPVGGYALAPGSPAPEVKPLTEQQSKAVTFVRDVMPDMVDLETRLNHGMALANSPLSSAGSTIGGYVGLGNVAASQEYKDANNAIGRFKGAVMQHLSGAAVSPSEAERNLPAFIPRYGDSPEEVLRKSERRRNYVNAVAETAKGAGDAVETGRRLIMQGNSELPPVRVTSPEDTKTLGPGQIIILPNGDRRQVPWPKNLLPK